MCYYMVCLNLQIYSGDGIEKTNVEVQYAYIMLYSGL